MSSSSVRAFVDVGVRDVYRDLESAGDGLEGVLTDALAAGAGWIADAARPFTPVGPGVKVGAQNVNDLLPHVFETIQGDAVGMTGRVYTDHPAGPVIEFGGTIAPSVRGGTRIAAVSDPAAIIVFNESAMVRKGAAGQLDRVEERIDSDIDALLAVHNL